MNPQLQSSLGRVASRKRRIQLLRNLAVCWAAAACLALAFTILRRQTGWTPLFAPEAVALATIVAAVFTGVRTRRARTEWHPLARQIEMRYSDLDGRLITMLEQHPK